MDLGNPPHSQLYLSSVLIFDLDTFTFAVPFTPLTHIPFYYALALAFEHNRTRFTCISAVLLHKHIISKINTVPCKCRNIRDQSSDTVVGVVQLKQCALRPGIQLGPETPVICNSVCS